MWGEKAKANLADLRERGKDAIGGDALELIKSYFTLEELAASDLRVALMIELANARVEKGISQKKLEELSGVKQPIMLYCWIFQVFCGKLAAEAGWFF